MTTQETLVALARQIAVYRGYTELVDGLQPLNTLLAKHLHEQEELLEAELHKTPLHVLHEAADVLYYAACIDAAEGKNETYPAGLRWLAARDIDPQAAERAALAKYGWRAGGEKRKDEVVELRLIAEATGMEGEA
jgi:hypothetical protein